MGPERQVIYLFSELDLDCTYIRIPTGYEEDTLWSVWENSFGVISGIHWKMLPVDMGSIQNQVTRWDQFRTSSNLV